MDKSIRIQRCIVSQKLASSFLDLLSTTICSLILYFIILYSVFATGFEYKEKKERINEIETSYNLDLKEGLDYQEYEIVIKNFYLTFEKEITNDFNKLHNKNYTIKHIYNIVVLRLVTDPKPENYKTDYFQYMQNQDGTFNPDEFALTIEGNSKNYKKNMHDIFYSSYKDLKILLEKYNAEYGELLIDVFNYESTSRLISFALSLLIFYIIIPLKSTYKSTLFEKIYGISHVNYKDGYLINNLKVILRPILLYLFYFLGLIRFSKFSIIILIIGSLFLNYLIMLFTNNNVDIPDKILKMESCSICESLIFKNHNEELEYLKKEEAKTIEDLAFLEKLENIKKFKIKK